MLVNEIPGVILFPGLWEPLIFLEVKLNCWVNNREAGDLRRHRTHYDVTVMIWPYYAISQKWCWLHSQIYFILTIVYFEFD